MKKVIFECAGNSVLFVLAGIMLVHPFSEFQKDANGFYVAIGIWPLIFALYLITFGVARFFVFRDGKKSLFRDSELTFADEREKIIVAESTKTAYQVLVFGLIVSMALLAGTRAFSLTIWENTGINLYGVGIALITSNLVLAMLSYCIQWCIAYRK